MSPYQATSSTRPSSPWTGQTIYETDTGRFLQWNGSAWVIPNSPAQNPTGLELIKTQTVGTAVTSVTVTDAFSANYENYKITYSGGTQSASTDIYVQIGNSTTGYYGVLVYSLVDGSIATAYRNNTSSMAWVGGGTAGQASTANFELMNPFLAQWTKIRNGSYENANNFGTLQGNHQVATSYSSFTIGVASGNITGGTIRVYGYRNS
jgi:hypothetical protein